MVNKKVSIGILIKALDLGGAEKQSLLLAKVLKSNYDIYYFVQKNHPQLKVHLNYIEREKINYIQLQGGYISRLFQIISYTKRYDIKIIFSYLTADNTLAAFVSIFTKIKIIGGVRNSCLPLLKFIFTKLLHRYFFDFIVFNNYCGRDLFVKRGFMLEKTLVIHNCIDKIHDCICRKDRETVKILSVGRFTVQKDYYTAVKTISLLKKMVDEKKIIEYIIIGDGKMEGKLKMWLKHFQVTNTIILKLPENIDNFYFDADIYFLCSIFEGIPNTIMEALNFSLPVVATNVGDVKYLVKEGYNGFLAPIKDYKKLAEKLYELICNPNKRNEFGINGHSLLIENFSEEKFRKKYDNLIKTLLYKN